MAYTCHVLVVAIIVILLLANLSLLPFKATALSFKYDFAVPSILERANLLYLNDSFADGDRISLTQMVKMSAGRVAYAQPVRLWDCRTGSVASFSTSFSFAIGGNHNITRGDGMAFFVGPFPPTLPFNSAAGFLGLYTNSSPLGLAPTVGVEFDPFWNLELDPPNVTDHVGIDINSIHSSAYTKDLPNLSLYGRMSANITYDASSKMMAASIQLADGSIHQVQTWVDLVAAGLPQDAGIGFSAATGGFWESHQLLSWSFNSTDMADVPLTDPSCKTKIQPWLISTILLGVVLFLLCVAIMLCFIILRRRRKTSLQVPREFTYEELCAATNNFSSDRRLGQGSFGEVYRGDLPGQPAVPVAVKKLILLSERTRKEFAREVMILGQMYHRNLVRLVGWCDSGYPSDRLLLVYELMAKSSVDKYLGPKGKRLLTWLERYKIVLGVGSAIEYLHTGCPKTFLHSDIKPSNVMLDDELEAKLGDFGLVKEMETQQGYIRGTRAGDMDYVDPVCLIENKVSIESDVYSFGVLLLEVATGKRPRGEDGKGSLVNDVRESKANGDVLGMADERLNGALDDNDKSQMKRVLDVGLLCVQDRREDRPKIRDAVNLLSNLSHPVPQIVSQ